MDVSLSRPKLFKELTYINGIVERKTTVPILANVLLETVGNSLRVTVTDLDVTLRCNCEASVKVSGTLTVSARKLFDIVRFAPNDVEIHLKATEDDWLEISYGRSRFKLATLAKTDPKRLPALFGTVTCAAEADIVRETLDATKTPIDWNIVVDEEGYFEHIKARATELVTIVGDPARVFEAGMRAASCIEQHRIAVAAAREAGFLATSNVEVARELGIIAGGTTGHEHTQRHFGDHAAFTAVRDSVAGEVTFLVDTYSTLECGLPTAIEVMQE